MSHLSSDTAQENPEARLGTIYQNKHFVLLWLAQAVSQTAQNAIWFGLLVIVEQYTRSSTQMGFVILTTILPSILLGMASGVFVDRLSKKRVLVWTNFLRAGVVLGYLLYERSLMLVYLINFASSTVTQFFGPAEAAKIPQLVPKRQLLMANSLFNLTYNAAQLAGIVLLGPPLVKFFGPPVLFVTAAVAFGVAGLLVQQLPHEEPPARGLRDLDKSEVVASVWHDIAEGWRFISADRRTSLAMLHLTLASALMLMVAMLAPRYVVAVLGIRPDDAVYVLAPAGVGVLLGTTSMGRLVRQVPKERLVSIGLLALGALLWPLAVVNLLGDYVIAPAIGRPDIPGGATVVPLVMLIAAATGVALALVIIPSQTILMERAPASTRGRIFAVQMVLGNVASILPLIFVGQLADWLGISMVIAGLSVAVFVIWIISTDSFAGRLARRR